MVDPDPEHRDTHRADEDPAERLVHQRRGEVDALLAAGRAAAAARVGEEAEREEQVDDRLGRGFEPVRGLAATDDDLRHLPEAQAEEAEDGDPEQDAADVVAGQGLHGSGLVGRAAPAAPRDLQCQPGDEQMHESVDGVPQSRRVLEDRVVAGLGGGLFDVVGVHGGHLRPTEP